ncbi:MAG TPA: ABC transporter transmembrane domain-containing protein [Gemmataceae bacterium]|jgi:ATP-binding cassette subfamily B protein
MPRHSRHARHEDNEELPAVPLSRASLRETVQLARYLLPYGFKFVAALVALLLSSLCGLAFPYLVGRLVNSAINHQNAGAPLPWHENVNGIALALVVLLAVQAALSYVQSLWFVEVSERSLADLRRDTYARLIRLPMAFHVRRRVGELASRLAADLTQILDTIVSAVPQLLHQLIVFAGGIALIALTSPRLTLVMLAAFPALIALAVFFGRALRRNAREATDRLADSNVIIEETLQGVASVKAFTNEMHEEQRYRTSLVAYLAVVVRGARYRGAFSSFVIFALFGAAVLVLWYGSRLVAGGTLSAGELMSFMIYTLFVAGAMGSFAHLYSQLQRTFGATHRVRELLQEEPESSEPAPEPSVKRVRGEIVYDHVAFRYPSRPEVPVLRDIAFTIEPGQRIALVGPSGAGKSTIASLLMRFYEPESGRILIDGRDARDYGLRELRGQMAIVPQDVLLFGGTIADNIAYGRPGAGEAEIVEAARQANADEFIRSFPDGYQTRVGERGVQLSGGQRQRVAIARAILRDPAILILDEATSSLDSASESLVLQALDRLMEGRTSLIIAHRLSTVRRADRIVVIKEGCTVESGTHDELVQRDGGVYRTLSQLQLDLTGSPAPEIKENDAWPQPHPSPDPVLPLRRP